MLDPQETIELVMNYLLTVDDKSAHINLMFIASAKSALRKPKQVNVELMDTDNKSIDYAIDYAKVIGEVEQLVSEGYVLHPLQVTDILNNLNAKKGTKVVSELNGTNIDRTGKYYIHARDFQTMDTEGDVLVSAKELKELLEKVSSQNTKIHIANANIKELIDKNSKLVDKYNTLSSYAPTPKQYRTMGGVSQFLDTLA